MTISLEHEFDTGLAVRVGRSPALLDVRATPRKTKTRTRSRRRRG